MEKLNRSWAEVNIDNIMNNICEIRRIVPKSTEIMGVVKADAYGHGVVEVSHTILKNGASRLAVSLIDEAIQLRLKGFDCPILILSYADPARADEIILNNLTQTVYSYELAKALSDSAVLLNRKVKIHVKIDTGMTRVGFMPGYSTVKSIVEISALPNIIVEGIFTHFASADEKDKTYTYQQFEKFMGICNELGRIGIHIPIKHVSNSAAIIQFPQMHLDLVRPGIILYGLYPSDDVDKSILNLKPAMSLKTNIILVKNAEKGTCVSYGRTFVTERESVIATLPIGYADGYSRLLSSKSSVLINGQLAPVIGRICMDQCMVDITDIDGSVSLGDEVVLFGTQADNNISVDDLAKAMGTINYEIVCIIGKRIPRAYLQDGQLKRVLNYLI